MVQCQVLSISLSISCGNIKNLSMLAMGQWQVCQLAVVTLKICQCCHRINDSLSINPVLNHSTLTAFLGPGLSGFISGLSIASRSMIRLCLCLIWPGGCVASFAVNCRLVICYHRASLLHICYVGSLTHVSGGVYEYLDAFRGPGSNPK